MEDNKLKKKFISAGAGSGKTYRITNDVADMIKSGQLKSEQVIMTTFTKAAAQELREKAKNELNKRGLNKEAQQMEHALIGTVHSVANTFLTKYWYLLGIMPDAAAMEEDEVQAFRDHSLRGLLSKEDRKFLYKYAEDYNVGYPQSNPKPGINYGFWKKDLCQVLDYIKWYDISEEQLKKSLETTESFIKCLEPKQGFSLDAPPSILNTLLQQTLSVVDRARKSNKKTTQIDFLGTINLNQLSISDIQTWRDIITDRGIETDESKVYLDWVKEVTTFPPSIASDHQKYAKIIFSLANKWQEVYREYKDEHHLIDFNDMEELFLQLLDEPEVQTDIKSRYTHLFVDEFQDSNPMQVRIFQKLSTLLNTVYVGDKKQAIYGFRGSDTELTNAIADSFSADDRKSLPYSYRTIKPLVDFSNKIFTQVFRDQTDVKLDMPKENGNYDKVDNPLRLWKFKKDKDLALQIQQLILREGLKAEDIAVLAHKNDDLDDLAEELRNLHVPVCRESSDIKESRTGRLIKALLTLVNSYKNQLARAEVAFLTMPGYHVSHIIENRLDHLNANMDPNDYLAEVPIIKKLIQLRKFRSNEEEKYSTNLLGYQSISALVESLIIELDLYSVVQSWDYAKAEETNLQVFIDLARKYEDNSTKQGQSATIAGFINYFTNQERKGAVNEEGVRLYTYHKSKGLEWKVVILMSLDKDWGKATDIATKSMLGCHFHREESPTADNPNKPMTISLVRNIYGKTNEAKDALVARLQEHPLWDDVRNKAISEAARLLYVGVTRARNVLILASKGDEVNLNWFRSVGAEVSENDYEIETIDKDNLLQWPENTQKTVHDLAVEFSPLNNQLHVSPSKSGKTPHDIKPINDVEHRMQIRRKKKEDALMGDFIHQVFCCCDDGISVDQIIQLRDSYGFTEKNVPEPQLLLDAWNYLIATLEKTYGPSVKRHHEKPFRHLDDNGHIVTGYIDLIWETENAYVVVDYKTCPGDYSLVFKPTSEHYVGCYGDQLDCYQRALEAEGKKRVKARVIYYPVTQFVVKVL